MGLDRHSGRCTLHAHSDYPGTVYDAESTETPLDLKSLLGLLSRFCVVDRAGIIRVRMQGAAS